MSIGKIMNFNLNFTPYRKTNSKWVTVKCKTVNSKSKMSKKIFSRESRENGREGITKIRICLKLIWPFKKEYT